MSRVEGILDRLHGLYPRLIDLSMDRLLVLLGRLGNPHDRLPPVIHVAGTNGKGSTCAFVRAIAEAAGLAVHVYTSPHLARFNERIRIAGALVDDAHAGGHAGGAVSAENAGAILSPFSRSSPPRRSICSRIRRPICACSKSASGGRGDATNVIARPAATAITSISMDPREMLGDTLAAIAAEKAGIIKPGVPVAIGAEPDEALSVLLETAIRIGAPVRLRAHDWDVTSTRHGFRYVDADGALALPKPALPGAFQLDNAGIAIAALRATTLPIPDEAFVDGVRPRRVARPPPTPDRSLRPHAARRLGAMAGRRPTIPAPGQALAEHFSGWSDRPLHLIVGLKQAKDAAEFLRPMLAHAATVWAVAEPDQHLALPVEAIIAASGGMAQPGPRIADALNKLPKDTWPARVLICGSLYLAGEVLKFDSP